MQTHAQKTSQWQVKNMSDIMDMQSPEHQEMIAAHHLKNLWTYAANCILAFWLLTGPFFFDYKSSALALSDIVSGAAVLLFEILAFAPKREMLRWGTCFVGIWLLFAPLVFWSATPAVYLLDTLAGSLFIAFSVLIPGMPGMGGMEMKGPDIPPGWNYNPSSWLQRAPMIALSLIGFLISRYLAAYQLGYISHPWDPFFGNGTATVLTSTVSKAWPISDAGFGALAYLLEALSGFMGDRTRWRTMPWMVLMFALLVVPLGVTSIVLVMMQPMVVHAWCGLCLIAAIAMLAMVPFALDEVVAMVQFLAAARRQGKDFWHIFWMGGTIENGGSPDPDRTTFSFTRRYIAGVQGVTLPWLLSAQIVIGTWLMAVPDVLRSTGAAANSDHLVGALILTIAAVAMAEVTRAARFLNTAIGLWMLAAPWLLGGFTPAAFWNELIAGALLIAVTLPKGQIFESYAGWDKYVK
jgi:hypothetical protein